MAKKIVKKATPRRKKIEPVVEQTPAVAIDLPVQEVEDIVADPSSRDLSRDVGRVESVEVFTKEAVEEKKQDAVSLTHHVINISSSTPTRDFALSVYKFFYEEKVDVVTIKSVGAGSGHQLTKSLIELNKILSAKGKFVSRYDFWTNEDGKSIINTRCILVDILPNSLATALTGDNVKYVPLKTAIAKEGVDVAN
jgi:hypothetical protein